METRDTPTSFIADHAEPVDRPWTVPVDRARLVHMSAARRFRSARPTPERPSIHRLAKALAMLVAAVLVFGVLGPLSAGATNAVADFEVEGDRVAGNPITFQDRSAGAAWVYWNFGDGSNSRELNPSHTFGQPGTYRVAYSVCASSADCATERRDVVIVDAFSSSTLMADWTVSGNQVAGQSLSFADTSTGDVAWVYWNFGDGSNSRDRSTSHAFAQPGSYTVRLHVCASVDNCDSLAQTIVVTAGSGSSGVTAAFTASPAAPIAGQAVSFADQSTGDVAWVYWNFGDGSNSRELNPSHTYAAAGTYTVRYSVCQNSTTCSLDTEQITVTGGDDVPLSTTNAYLSAETTAYTADDGTQLGRAIVTAEIPCSDVELFISRLDGGPDDDRVQVSGPTFFEIVEDGLRKRIVSFEVTGLELGAGYEPVFVPDGNNPQCPDGVFAEVVFGQFTASAAAGSGSEV